jgi:hypothetical protein
MSQVSPHLKERRWAMQAQSSQVRRELHQQNVMRLKQLVFVLV